jgi:DNA-binding transcriptional LysR family regulator
MQSISKAARELYISQPAMSTHMNAIEKAMGAQLLIRGRQTRLTPVGEVVLRGFREILAEYDSLLQAVDVAVEMNNNRDLGIPVPDYIDENVSDKVVKITQSYTGVVNKMVWRKL